jgi:hypothetical protein
MAKQIESIEVHPGENGGHRVVHNFKRETGKKGGAMNGGVYIERPKSEEHLFGASERGKVASHIAKALDIPLNAGNNKADTGY